MGEGAGFDQAAAQRRFRFELAAHPGSPAQARRLARARLTGWSVCEDTCDTAALVISELVTNAVVHTASGVVVCELYDGDDLVRIAVRDEGCAPGEPHPSPQRPEEEHGRGLFLVDALCHSWGAQEHGSGLLVWADLSRRASDAPQEPGNPGSSGETALPGRAGRSEDAVGRGHSGRSAHSAGRHDDLTVHDAPAADPVRVPRADLGWGARPKPDPAGGPDDEADAPDEHNDQADARLQDVPHTDLRHTDVRHGDLRHADIRHADIRHAETPHGHPVHGAAGHGHDGHGDAGTAEQARRTHPAEGRTEARASGHPHRPSHTLADGRSDTARPGVPLGRLPYPSDGPPPRIAPQWHRGPGTGESSRPADRADHALDTTGGAPVRRPHPGTDPVGLPPRGRDTA
ncbi:ATP-binding protein [Streptomyces sp. NPDC003401]